MKEDIKTLKKAIKTFKKNQKHNFPLGTLMFIDEEEIQAIENLINRVKELEAKEDLLK